MQVEALNKDIQVLDRFVTYLSILALEHIECRHHKRHSRYDTLKLGRLYDEVYVDLGGEWIFYGRQLLHNR
jgi:hypothetical protein